MTVPKKQSTAAKKARALQRQAGGKHTTLLAAQTCGKALDPFGLYEGTCARAPHSSLEPCDTDRDFDAQAWQRQADLEHAAAQARWQALTPEERAHEERLAFEEVHDDGRTAGDDYEDARSWKWED